MAQKTLEAIYWNGNKHGHRLTVLKDNRGKDGTVNLHNAAGKLIVGVCPVVPMDKPVIGSCSIIEDKEEAPPSDPK